MICSSCRKAKPDIQVRESKLVKQQRLFLCEACIDLEPRWLIILTARSEGIDCVIDYINKKRYIGREIELKEITE